MPVGSLPPIETPEPPVEPAAEPTAEPTSASLTSGLLAALQQWTDSAVQTNSYHETIDVAGGGLFSVQCSFAAEALVVVNSPESSIFVLAGSGTPVVGPGGYDYQMGGGSILRARVPGIRQVSILMPIAPSSGSKLLDVYLFAGSLAALVPVIELNAIPFPPPT